MKNKFSLPILLILLVFFGGSGFAQENDLRQRYQFNQQLIQAEEQNIENYINRQMSSEFPESILDEIKSGLTKHEDFSTFSEGDKVQIINSAKRHYWRIDYFHKNPKAAEPYQALIASSCTNGDFEDGTFLTYGGESAVASANGYQIGDCDILTNDPIYLGQPINFTPDDPNTAITGNFSIMNVGADPLVTTGTLQRVWNGDHSARINSHLDAPGFSRPEYGVNKLIKRVVLSEVDETIYFNYALVLEDPSGHNNEKPTFVARVLDAAGNECDRICHSAYATDPFLLEAVPGGSRRYKPWNCENLQACGQPGDTVTLEFIQTDCGQGAHWGYAYIDDICDTCSGVIDTCNFQGSINILPTDTCVGDTMQVCVEYTLAAQNCNTFSADEIRLYIRQGGAIVSGPLTITNPTGLTACFTVTPGDLPPGTTIGEGFDFYTEIDFSFGTGSTTANDYNSNSGLDNDYVLGAECCPEFTLLTCCELTGGTLNTKSDQATINPTVQKRMDDYKKAVAAKYPSFDPASDGCCDYCQYPDVPFPVFIYDETGTMLIDNSVYAITWSNDPTNNTAIGEVLPDEMVIVTVSGPDSCVWTDTFNLVCCVDPGLPGICCDSIDFTVDLDSLCNFDPCKYPTLQFPVRVSRDGVVITTANYGFLWSNGTTGDATSVSYNDLPISVTVTDNSTGCTTVGTYDIDCGPDPCIIKAPDRLDCKTTTEKQILIWNSIPNAVSYQIEFYYNDPDCCNNGQPGSITLPINVNDTVYTVSLSDCFSWRVRSVCADGTVSDWSAKKCSCGPTVSCFIKAPEKLACRTTRSSQVLTWSSVSNAAYYQIEFYKNDPECCGSGNPGSITLPIDVNDTTYVIGNLNDCFSWRVRAVCADGTVSAWSKKECSCAPTVSCLIPAPNGLSCTTSRNGQILSWNPVANAVSYQISFYYNDPDCCRNGQPGSISFPTDVNGTSYTVTDLNACFSWSVRAKCSDGTLSAWTKSCSCGFSSTSPQGNRNKSDNGLGAVSDEELHYSALPNPSKDQVTIKFHDHSGANINNATIIITEMTNKEVYKSTISNNEAKQIDVTNFKTGVYIYRIIHEDKVLVNDKLMVE